MDELLQYYEHELGTLHAHNQAFARRYPAIAGALGIVGGDMGDPHLARMLQAFAMFNARTAKRLADGFGAFSETLLEINFPEYLRPFPACAIARIDNDLATVTELATIPRGTVMHAAEHQGVACKFTTAYDVAVVPLRLSDVRFQSVIAAPPALRLAPDLGAAISITLEATGATSTLDGLPLPALRLFLDGEPSFCATLRDSLFQHVRCACVEVDGAWQALEAPPLHPVGFAAEEALMPPWPPRISPTACWANGLPFQINSISSIWTWPRCSGACPGLPALHRAPAAGRSAGSPTAHREAETAKAHRG